MRVKTSDTVSDHTTSYVNWVCSVSPEIMPQHNTGIFYITFINRLNVQKTCGDSFSFISDCKTKCPRPLTYK